MNDVDVGRFESYRPLMFSIAYRMLGSVTDAEDIVQKAYLRYQATDHEEIISHQAYLSTIVTRLCLNHLDLARTQRETYIGSWLPEPVITTSTDEHFAPAKRAELHESLSLAFLTLLEQLTPLERAVFLLREVFDYDYADIAAIIDKEEAACRQLLSRAKKHIADHRPRFKPSPEVHRQILSQFIDTVVNGDIEGLLQLLSEDVELWADSNGKLRGAITRPLFGRDVVTRFLVTARRFAPDDAYQDILDVNGEPTFAVRLGDETRILISLTIDGGLVRVIRIMGNPDKLKWVNQANDDAKGKSE